MKLLYFTIQLNLAGGLARVVSDKINWLVANGHEVSICNIENIDVNPYYPLDGRVNIIKGGLSTLPGGIFTRAKGVLNSYKRLLEIIKEISPDLIVNAHCPLITWLLPWVRKDIPKVVEIHQCHHGIKLFDKQFMHPLTAYLHIRLLKWIYSRYDRFVVLTNGDKYAWSSPKNCVVIPNFSNLNKAKEEIDRECHYQIIMLARLMPQKRIDLMINAWSLIAKQYPQWSVMVYGEGMLKSALNELIRGLDLQNSFYLMGETKTPENVLMDSDIMCLTSEYEGFPLVVIEAMKKRVPVLVMDYVGVEDIVTHRKNGLITKFGDITEFAQMLQMLMDSAALRKELSDNAFECVKKFDKERVMNMWMELFQSLERQSS